MPELPQRPSSPVPGLVVLASALVSALAVLVVELGVELVASFLGSKKVEKLVLPGFDKLAHVVG